MSLHKRHWLSWADASSLLGFDSEGLRQEVLHRTDNDTRSMWLPAYIWTTAESFFASHFGFDGYEREASYASAKNEEYIALVPNEFAILCNEQHESAELPFRLPGIGRTKSVSWVATDHHLGSGWSNTFFLEGELVLHPEAFAAICEQDGHVDNLLPCAAPAEWCRDGIFPREYFRIICDHDLVRRFNRHGGAQLTYPSSAESCIRFRAEDVWRIKNGADSSVEVMPAPTSKPTLHVFCSRSGSGSIGSRRGRSVQPGSTAYPNGYATSS